MSAARGARGERERPLSPEAARTFYNLADAWIPPSAAGDAGGGDLDLLAVIVQRGLGPRETRDWERLARLLRRIEWRPLLTLRARRRFSWLARQRRRQLLDRWSTARGGRARELAALRELVDAAFRAEKSPGSG